MKMAAENSPVERLTEPKNAIKTTWPKALQGSLKIRWRPFNCGSPPIKKVLALNSYSLCPESGTLQSSLVCCRMLILLPSSLRTSASYPPQHKGHQARVRPALINVFANHILMLCSRNPLAAGLPQQETRMSFNRRAANLTRGGIKMKSIQTKFIVLILGCILLSSSVIGGTGVLNAKHAMDEDSVKIMNLMCKEKNQELNALLSRIQQPVKTLTICSIEQLESVERLKTR